MKTSSNNSSNKLDALKKELDMIEVEERLEMVDVTAVMAGCCCFCNDGCNGTC